MKLWKKREKLIFVLIFLICFDLSLQALDCSSSYCYKSDTSCYDKSTTNTCPSRCLPRYDGGSTACYDCSGFSNNYYSIISGACSNICQGDKIIANARYNNIGECTSAAVSGTYFRLGDVYYPTSTGFGASCNSNTRTCACQNYFYFENLNGKKIYKCYSSLSNVKSAGYNFYNHKTKQVYPNRCPEGYEKKKILQALLLQDALTNVKRMNIMLQF